MSILQQHWTVALLKRRERDNENLVPLTGRVQKVTQAQYDSVVNQLGNDPVMLYGYELQVETPNA